MRNNYVTCWVPVAHYCKRSLWWQICIILLGRGWKDTLLTDKVIKFLTNLSRLRCSHKVCVFFFLPYSFEVLSDNCVKEGIMHSKETSIPSGLPSRYAKRLWYYVGIGYYNGASSWTYTTFVIGSKDGHRGAKLKWLMWRKPWRNMWWNGDSKRLTDSGKDMLHKFLRLSKSTSYTAQSNNDWDKNNCNSFKRFVSHKWVRTRQDPWKHK